jgi:pyrroline-5-carboxylate reductase
MPRSSAAEVDSSFLREFAGSLVLVGAGKMGGALLDGWVRLGLDPARVAVVDPDAPSTIAALSARGLRLNPAPEGPAADVLLMAVKPQIAGEVAPTLSRWVGPQTLLVSVMAGRTLQFLSASVPAATAIVRAMPNTPAAIGRGITVAVPSAGVTEPQRRVAHELLAAVGEVEWVQDEALLDAVTAVSGSGPAYVFLLAETLARAGTAAGLPAELADRLARATVAGSGELLHQSSLSAATLRENVTSPGGTTAAALNVLMAENGLARLMEQAVLAATRRSVELAG